MGFASCLFAPLQCLFQGMKEIRAENIIPLIFLGVFQFVGQIFKNKSAMFGKASKVALITYIEGFQLIPLQQLDVLSYVTLQHT